MIKFLFKIIPETIKRYARRIIAISGGIVDPKGYGFLNLMFENAMVPPKYQYMFDGEEENPIFVDCGANVGLIIDIARFVGMEVYAFEPSKSAFRLLKKKYEGDDKIHLYQKAVSDKFTTVNFYYNEHALYDQSASLIHPMKPTKNPVSYEVESVRLVEILKNDILSKHKKIHLLKLDVEGAEFAIMEDIIKSDIYIGTLLTLS